MIEDPTDTVRFHFLKSNFYRVVHADGAYGGVTPRQGIFVTFYSERLPIPKVMVNHVDAAGRLREEIRSERQVKDGVIRESEVGVAMDLEVAKSLLIWLKDKIEILEAQKVSTETLERQAL